MEPIWETLNIHDPWLLAVAVLAVSAGITGIAWAAMRLILGSWAQTGRGSRMEASLLRRAQRSILSLGPAIGAWAAVKSLHLKSPMPNLLMRSILILVVARAVLKFTNDGLKWWENRFRLLEPARNNDELIMLARRVLGIAGYFIAAMLVLHEWGMEIGPFVAALGVGGLAVGLALQPLLSNVFGGAQLIVDGSINVGDKIQLESGETGIVTDIGLRSTKMRTPNNEILYVPNAQLASSRIRNFARPDTQLRLEIPFSVGYGSDVEQVRKLVLASVAGVPDVIAEPPAQVFFLEMGQWSLNFVARVWIGNYDRGAEANDALTAAIYRVLTDNRIEIPFPTYSLHHRKADA